MHIPVGGQKNLSHLVYSNLTLHRFLPRDNLLVSPHNPFLLFYHPSFGILFTFQPFTEPVLSLFFFFFSLYITDYYTCIPSPFHLCLAAPLIHQSLPCLPLPLPFLLVSWAASGIHSSPNTLVVLPPQGPWELLAVISFRAHPARHLACSLTHNFWLLHPLLLATYTYPATTLFASLTASTLASILSSQRSSLKQLLISATTLPVI